MPGQRAVQPEQKQARRDAVLAAALDLFADQPYQALGMQAIADRAGLAKGTLYLYFPTKESLFLALYEQESAAWLECLETALRVSSGRLDADAATSLLVRGLRARPQLARLAALLHVVLEHNVDYAALLAFRRRLAVRFMRVGGALEVTLPFLAGGGGARLLLRVHALIVGFQHAAEPVPALSQARHRPDLALFNIGFFAELQATLRALLRGLEEKRHAK